MMGGILIHGRMLSAQCELLDVTQRTEPDESWSYVDPAGHLHVWVQVNGQMVVPSTKEIVDVPASSLDGEDFTPAVTHRACTGCGATVVPGWRAATQVMYAAGVKHFTLDGEPISAEEAEYFHRTGRRLPPYEDLERRRNG